MGLPRASDSAEARIADGIETAAGCVVDHRASDLAPVGSERRARAHVDVEGVGICFTAR